MLVAERGHERTPAPVGVVERAGHPGDDGALLCLRRRRIGRVGRAVEQPRVDEERHVHHVDADVAGVGQRVDGRLQEEVARVLAALELDQADVGGHTGDADSVGRRPDGPGDVGAMATVVDTYRVETARHLTWPVDLWQILAKFLEGPSRSSERCPDGSATTPVPGFRRSPAVTWGRLVGQGRGGSCASPTACHRAGPSGSGARRRWSRRGCGSAGRRPFHNGRLLLWCLADHGPVGRAGQLRSCRGLLNEAAFRRHHAEHAHGIVTTDDRSTGSFDGGDGVDGTDVFSC